MKRNEDAAVGGLLHDIGKIVYRAGIDSGKHSGSGYRWMAEFADEAKSRNILDCIRYHHAVEINNARIEADSPAFAVYIADNIAAGADRRAQIKPPDGDKPEEQPFQKTLPVNSVFNLIWGGNLNFCHSGDNLGCSANYPRDPITLTQEFYLQKTAELKGELSKLFSPSMESDYINSLLNVMENTLSFIPSSTYTREVADISLYDHSKMTAAVAAAICSYLDTAKRHDFKTELLKREHDFLNENAFLMFSCDFSGIQKFIYQIGSKNALKSLRSRSFFLELLMEYLMDDLLQQCGMSRANLIYTGGGHCYAIIPNTEETQLILNKFEKNTNSWLIGQFQASLYLACAWRECSGNDLRNDPAEKSPYQQIYSDLSKIISRKKLSRYTPDELRLLNSPFPAKDGRECKICGITEKLTETEEICFWCDTFAKISNSILKEDVFAVVTEKNIGNNASIPVPNVFGTDERHIAFVGYNAAIKLHMEDKALRVYSKNKTYTGFRYSTKIYMGDYSSSRLFEDLVREASGIKRIAVLRADVDNLGTAFISGFERKGSGISVQERDTYKTLSRTAAFSRQMSLFFKHYINSILKQDDEGIAYFRLTDKDHIDGKNVVIVYSGGDDIFLVGGWDDVIETAVDIRNAFNKFTAGTLTISAGIEVCRQKYPLYAAAEKAALLEAKSKKLEGKDGITLFTDSGEHTYKWDSFIGNVIPKFRLLSGFLDREDEEKGKAFLYKLLELIRGADDKINIARCAYMLARLEPDGGEERKAAYSDFSKKMFTWISDVDNRKELITAIHIYLYIIRKGNDDK